MTRLVAQFRRLRNSPGQSSFTAALGGAATVYLGLIGIHTLFGFHPAYRPAYIFVIWVAVALGGRTPGWAAAGLVASGNLWVDHLAGTEMGTELLTGLPIRLVIYLAIATLLASLQEAVLHHRNDAHHDPLTGLPNRRALHDDPLFEGDAPLAVAVLDCDRFKQINDTYGHRAGDQMLRELARVLRREIRRTDRAFRMGGDEFVVLMRRTTLAEATIVLGRIRAEFATVTAKMGMPATLSYGLSVSDRPRELEALIDRADANLYGSRQDRRGIQVL